MRKRLRAKRYVFEDVGCVFPGSKPLGPAESSAPSAGVRNRMEFWGGRGASSTVERDGLQVAKGRGEDPGPGIGFRHRDPDVADGQTDSGADLEQLQPNRMALGPRHVGSLQAQPAQRMQEHVGGRRQVLCGRSSTVLRLYGLALDRVAQGWFLSLVKRRSVSIGKCTSDNGVDVHGNASLCCCNRCGSGPSVAPAASIRGQRRWTGATPTIRGPWIGRGGRAHVHASPRPSGNGIRLTAQTAFV